MSWEGGRGATIQEAAMSLLIAVRRLCTSIYVYTVAFDVCVMYVSLLHAGMLFGHFRVVSYVYSSRLV